MRLWLMVAALVFAALPARAQSPVEKDVLVRPPERVLRMVDDLKRLTEGAERNQLAAGRFLFDLRSLVKLYDWPWRKRMIEDDFTDGDLARHPAWTVVKGEAMADAQGLTLKGAGEIAQAKRMPNAVAVVATVKTSVGATLSLAFRQGEAKATGYRLDVAPGKAMTIVRLTAQGPVAIAQESLGRELADGKEHVLIWTRDADGRMQAGLDGKRLIAVQERSNLDPFDHVALHNEGGWTLRAISVEGM